MKKKQLLSNIYHPTYKVRKTLYIRNIDLQKEVEAIGVYKADEHIFNNPPTHKETIDKITKLLKGTGISKFTITFLRDTL